MNGLRSERCRSSLIKEEVTCWKKKLPKDVHSIICNSKPLKQGKGYRCGSELWSQTSKSLFSPGTACRWPCCLFLGVSPTGALKLNCICHSLDASIMLFRCFFTLTGYNFRVQTIDVKKQYTLHLRVTVGKPRTVLEVPWHFLLIVLYYRDDVDIRESAQGRPNSLRHFEILASQNRWN